MEAPCVLTSAQCTRLRSIMDAMRVIAAPVGPMHSFWDWIGELEALDRGLPRLLSLSVEQTLDDAEAALARVQKEHP